MYAKLLTVPPAGRVMGSTCIYLLLYVCVPLSMPVSSKCNMLRSVWGSHCRCYSYS